MPKHSFEYVCVHRTVFEGFYNVSPGVREDIVGNLGRKRPELHSRTVTSCVRNAKEYQAMPILSTTIQKLSTFQEGLHCFLDRRVALIVVCIDQGLPVSLSLRYKGISEKINTCFTSKPPRLCAIRTMGRLISCKYLSI